MTILAVLAVFALSLTPDGSRDRTAEVKSAIEQMRSAGGGEVEFAPGDYHFRAESATPLRFYVSNHDQIDVHPVQIPLTGLTNVTVRGNGARFVLHGATTAFAVIDSANVRIEGVSVDWNRPFLTEATVEGFEAGGTLVSVDAKTFPYDVRDGKFTALGEGWESTSRWLMAFRGDTHALVENTVDIAWEGDVVETRGDGRFLMKCDLSKEGVRTGDLLAIRPMGRPHPAVFVSRAKDTALVDFVVHTAWGMGVICQRSENFSWLGTGKASARTSGVFAPKGSGRFATLHADASHFSNVKGLVRVENCLFEGMMDDAINVHSTCLKIVERIPDGRLRCCFMHAQAYGFEAFLPGETLRFIRGRTLENGPERKVAAAEVVDPKEIVVTLDGAVPEGFGVGDAVENADYQPAVDFIGNVVARNRARGALFTTPRQVMVVGNLFERVSGSAILLAGDAQGWYESGACENLMIRDNVFRDCLTSKFQFCDGIISFAPMVKDLDAQKRCYHRDITIMNNVFETFDVPLVSAVSTDNLYFRGNTVRYNRHFRSWGKKAFELDHCRRIHVEDDNPGLTDGTDPNPFRAGFAKTDITPPLGTPISGYYRRRVSDGVHDPLHARCLALSDGTSVALVYMVDNLHLADAVAAEVKAEITRKTGVSAEAIFLAATHIHTGPSCSVDPLNALPDDLAAVKLSNALLASRCADCGVRAIADLAPTKIRIGRGEAKGISFIRRFRMKDGTQRTNPAFGDPDIVGPIGEPDEQLQLVRFVREGAKEIDLMNFQTHPDVIGGTKFSSDWPGLACDCLEGAMGGEVHALLINGAQGDTNHYRRHWEKDEPHLRGGYAMSQHMARVVAAGALAVWARCHEVPAGRIGTLVRDVTVRANKGRPEEYPEAERIVTLHRAGRANELPQKGMEQTALVAGAYRMLELRDKPDEIGIPVAAISVGRSLAIGGFPGEPFTWMGTETKRRSPFAMTVPACCANGSRGYFPVESAYGEGGYENATSRYAKGVAERLTDGLVGVLEMLYRKGGVVRGESTGRSL